MPTQKFINRSHGQRLRRDRETAQATNEVVSALVEGQAMTAEVVSQHDRDIKMLRARVSELEARHNSHAKD